MAWIFRGMSWEFSARNGEMCSYLIANSEMDMSQQFSALKTDFAKENQEHMPRYGGMGTEGKREETDR